MVITNSTCMIYIAKKSVIKEKISTIIIVKDANLKYIINK